MKKIYLIIAILYLFGCSSKPAAVSPGAEPETEITSVTLNAEQIKNGGIGTAIPEMRSIQSRLRVTGIIDVPPQNLVSISFPMGGFLKSSKLLPGMRVVKGEVLGVMEDAQYIELQQNFLLAQNKLSLTEQEFNRQKELNLSKASSDKIFQQAESNFQEQKIQIRALSEKLKILGVDPGKLDEKNLSRSLNLLSPINGFVSAVNVNIGKYVNPSDVLFELVNPDDIHLNLSVFEKDLPFISIGQKVVTWTNDRPNLKHPAEIILISHNIRENRTAEVHCHFEDYDKSLFPGMYMNAEIAVQQANSLSVPEAAIIRWQGKHYVFEEILPGQFEKIEVNPGKTSDGFTSLDLTETEPWMGKKIVIKGAFLLLSKMMNTEEE